MTTTPTSTSRSIGTTTTGSNRRRPALVRTIVLVLLAGALLGATPGLAGAHHRSRVTTDVTRQLSSTQLFQISKGYATAAQKALAGCGAPGGAAATAAVANLRYAVRLTPFGMVSAAWTGAIWHGYQKATGINFCDIAYKASQGAAWAAWHASRGGTTSRVYVIQEDRHLAPDVCRMWQSFGNQWIVSDLRTGVSPFSGGCPKA